MTSRQLVGLAQDVCQFANAPSDDDPARRWTRSIDAQIDAHCSLLVEEVQAANGRTHVLSADRISRQIIAIAALARRGARCSVMPWIDELNLSVATLPANWTFRLQRTPRLMNAPSQRPLPLFSDET